MALKNNLDTCGSAPSLLRMRAILLQTALSQDKFLATAGQPLSAVKITLRNFLEANQFIYFSRRFLKNRNPLHNLPQTWGGKQICMYSFDMSHWKISITPKEKFQDMQT